MIEIIRKNIKITGSILIIFYTVGIVGIANQSTASLFTSLTPFALLLSAFLIAIYHEKFDLKTIGTFALIYLLGFMSEERGVNTGLIFGNYSYGDTLGIRINGTPLIIGLNWLMLTYLTASIVDNFKLNVFLKIISAALLMLIYDIVLEQLAPKLDMWTWENNVVPIQNYVAWFILAVVFQSVLKIRGITVRNKISTLVFSVQFLFFLTLFLLYKL